ncbi:MAG: hypothetical protein ACRD2J_02940 [Thermoanaerobaculia bacterium]
MSRRSRFVSALILIAVVAIVPASSAEESDESKQPVHEYELTTAGLEKFEKTVANLEKVAKTLREAGPPEEEEDGEDDGSTEKMIAAMTRVCERIDVFRTAVDEAGFSCRDYTLFNITLMQASMLGYGYEARGEEFLESFPGGTTERVRANLRFAIDNKERIRKVGERQQKIFAPE